MAKSMSKISKLAACILFIVNFIVMVTCVLMFTFGLWIIISPSSLSSVVNASGHATLKMLIQYMTLRVGIAITAVAIFVFFIWLSKAFSKSPLLLLMAKEDIVNSKTSPSPEDEKEQEEIKSQTGANKDAEVTETKKVGDKTIAGRHVDSGACIKVATPTEACVLNSTRNTMQTVLTDTKENNELDIKAKRKEQGDHVVTKETDSESASKTNPGRHVVVDEDAGDGTQDGIIELQAITTKKDSVDPESKTIQNHLLCNVEAIDINVRCDAKDQINFAITKVTDAVGTNEINLEYDDNLETEGETEKLKDNKITDWSVKAVQVETSVEESPVNQTSNTQNGLADNKGNVRPDIKIKDKHVDQTMKKEVDREGTNETNKTLQGDVKELYGVFHFTELSGNMRGDVLPDEVKGKLERLTKRTRSKRPLHKHTSKKALKLPSSGSVGGAFSTTTISAQSAGRSSLTDAVGTKETNMKKVLDPESTSKTNPALQVVVDEDGSDGTQDGIVEAIPRRKDSVNSESKTIQNHLLGNEKAIEINVRNDSKDQINSAITKVTDAVGTNETHLEFNSNLKTQGDTEKSEDNKITDFSEKVVQAGAPGGNSVNEISNTHNGLTDNKGNVEPDAAKEDADREVTYETNKEPQGDVKALYDILHIAELSENIRVDGNTTGLPDELKGELENTNKKLDEKKMPEIQENKSKTSLEVLYDLRSSDEDETEVRKLTKQAKEEMVNLTMSSSPEHEKEQEEIKSETGANKDFEVTETKETGDKTNPGRHGDSLACFKAIPIKKDSVNHESKTILNHLLGNETAIEINVRRDSKDQIDSIITKVKDAVDTNEANFEFNGNLKIQGDNKNSRDNTITKLVGKVLQVATPAEGSPVNQTLNKQNGLADNKENVGPDFNIKDEQDHKVKEEVDRDHTTETSKKLQINVKAHDNNVHIIELSGKIRAVVTEEDSKNSSKTIPNPLDGDKVDKKRDIETESNKQQNHKITKVIDIEGTSNTNPELQLNLDYEILAELIDIILTQQDGKENFSRYQIIEYLKNFCKPLIEEAVQHMLPSIPQNPKGLHKEPVPIERSRNSIKQPNDELQNDKETNGKLQKEKEPNDVLQNEEETNDQVQNDKELNDQLQNDKEPNDQLEPIEVKLEKLSGTQEVQKDLINPKDADNKADSDKFKDTLKKVHTKEVPDDDKADKNLSLHDEKIPNDQGNSQEMKPEKPVLVSTEADSKNSSKTILNSLDGNKVDKERDIGTESNKQQNQAMAKIIDIEGTINTNIELQPNLDYEILAELIDIILTQQDGQENSSRYQIVEYLKDFCKPLIEEAVQHILPSIPQNTKGLDKKPMPIGRSGNNFKQPNDELQNDKESNGKLQKKKEPNDVLQNEKETNDQVQKDKELNNQLQNDKEPNDQLEPIEVRLEKPVLVSTEADSKNSSKTVLNSLDGNKVDKERDIGTESNKQQNQAMAKVIDHEESNNTNPELQPNLDYKKNTELFEMVLSEQDQIIEYLSAVFKPLIVEAVQNIIPSSPQNGKGLEKELLRLVADQSNNIKGSNDHLQNKEKSSDQLQNETERNDKLKNDKESNYQVQNEKERNDQLENENESNDELENEKDPNDQLQNDKEPNDQLQNAKQLNDQLLNNKQAYDQLKNEQVSNHQLQKAEEPNSQLEPEETKLERPDVVQDVEVITVQTESQGARIITEVDEFKEKLIDNNKCSAKESSNDGKVPQNLELDEKKEHSNQTELQEVKLEKLVQETEHSKVLYAEVLQIVTSFVVPELKKNLQKKFSSLKNDSEISIKTIDTPNFESTRIEGSDEEDRHEEGLLMDLTGISKEMVVEQQNGDQQPSEEELQKKVKTDEHVVEANDINTKTNGFLDLGKTSSTADGSKGESLQEPLRFHAVHGDNIWLSKNNLRAQRKKKSNFSSTGIAFSSRPVAIGEKVSLHLKQRLSSWLGNITIGFTTNDPNSIASNLPTNVIIERNCADGFWAERLEMKYYQKSSRLHYYLNSSGNMCFGVNGVDKIEFSWNLEMTTPVWALIDLLGYFSTVEFEIPKQFCFKSFAEKSSLLPGRNESGDSWSCSWEDDHANKTCLNYQTSFVPLDLYTQFEGTCIKFLEDRGVGMCLDDKGGCINGKFPLFPGQTIVVQNLSARKALFHIGVKYCSPTIDASSKLRDTVLLNVNIRLKDELAITFTENGEVQVTKNIDVPKTILKVSRSQELWPFVKIFRRNHMIKMWSSNTGVAREGSLSVLQL